MTITLNRNVLIFTVLLLALGVAGYVVGSGRSDPPAATTEVVQPPISVAADPANPMLPPTAVPDAAPRVTMDDFKAAYDAGEDMVIVDVRVASQYATGHIAGAINIPETEALARQAELPRDRRIVLYCA